MLQHLRAPILIDHAQILQVELLDDQDCQPVISIFQQKFDYVLGLELLQLLERHGSGEVWRVPHFREHDRVLDYVDVLVRVEVGRIAELLREGSRG